MESTQKTNKNLTKNENIIDMVSIKQLGIETPQEIQLWVLIPAIKKEIARFLTKDKNMPQKEVSKLLKTTPASISQYLHGKRGSKINFKATINEQIDEIALKIIDENKNPTKEILDLINEKQMKKLVCLIHKNIDPEFNSCERSK